jgi:hypothetical protein
VRNSGGRAGTAALERDTRATTSPLLGAVPNRRPA